jgi:hypothetical protein
MPMNLVVARQGFAPLRCRRMVIPCSCGDDHMQANGDAFKPMNFAASNHVS